MMLKFLTSVTQKSWICSRDTSELYHPWLLLGDEDINGAGLLPQNGYVKCYLQKYSDKGQQKWIQKTIPLCR